ncbi:MAG: hypothetical protein Q7T50_00090 [Candidatus Magasanikbacteria bacterium]|nr:hypothetical protein [Candidatus Magasanikbacteria bacterium]
MGIDDLLKDAQNLTDEQFENRLNRLVHENSSFQNLDHENKKVVVEIFRRFKERLRKGYGISSRTIRDESMRLYKNRVELGLTEEDMRDIKDIMHGFQGEKERGRKSILSWFGF